MCSREEQTRPAKVFAPTRKVVSEPLETCLESNKNVEVEKDQGVDLFSDNEPHTIARGNIRQASNPDVVQERNIKRTFEDKAVLVEGLRRRKYIKNCYLVH